MKNGIFIVYDDLSIQNGVNKKIINQIDTMNHVGLKVFPYQMKKGEGKALYKLLYRLPFSNISPKWEYSYIFEEVEFIYLRRPLFLSIWTISLLRKIRRKNPKVKILYEIPTYPYDKEITKNKKNIPIYIKDVFNRRLLKKYIDRICILTNEKQIFGIPTIKIWNGYDFDKVKQRVPSIDEGVVNIAIVAQFDSWHGYERLISGLRSYYANGGKRNIKLHFAGDGPEKRHYEELSKENGIEEHVIFYGMLPYNRLMELYNNCDIGASSFGMYKINIDYGCTLKTREYLAKGLPIISGCRLDINDIEGLNEFVLNFPNNSSEVDFNKIVKFYDFLYRGKDKEDITRMINKIRQLAELNLNMEKALVNVINYIGDGRVCNENRNGGWG